MSCCTEVLLPAEAWLLTSACSCSQISFFRGLWICPGTCAVTVALTGITRSPGFFCLNSLVLFRLLCSEPNLSPLTLFLIAQKLVTSVFHVECKFQDFYCVIKKLQNCYSSAKSLTVCHDHPSLASPDLDPVGPFSGGFSGRAVSPYSFPEMTACCATAKGFSSIKVPAGASTFLVFFSLSRIVLWD